MTPRQAAAAVLLAAGSALVAACFLSDTVLFPAAFLTALFLLGLAAWSFASLCLGVARPVVRAARRGRHAR